MIKIDVLGAGGHVGKSAFLVTFADNVKIMLDCGIQVTKKNDPFPNLDLLIERTPNSPPWRVFNILTSLSAVFITHYHLDHIGALPYLTEVLKYKGPIYMSSSTKLQANLLLRDCWLSCKDFLSTHQPELKNARLDWRQTSISEQMITNCMNKVTCIDFNVKTLIEGLAVTMLPAGHVPGASMFSIRYNSCHVVYTGDFTLADSEILYPSLAKEDLNEIKNATVVISEATYASQIRDANSVILRELCMLIEDTVKAKGKVLIPSNAIGKTQELAFALALYWQEYSIDVPIVLSPGLMHQGWQIFEHLNNLNQFKQQNRLLDKYISIKPFHEIQFASDPLVYFLAPKTLDFGLPNQLFQAWGGDPKNLTLLTGFATNSTIINQLNLGKKTIVLKNKILEVQSKFRYFSLASHCDSCALQRIMKTINPVHSLLVHGELSGIQCLASILRKTLNRPVYTPRNNDMIVFNAPLNINLQLNLVDLNKQELYKKFEHCFLILYKLLELKLSGFKKICSFDNTLNELIRTFS